MYNSNIENSSSMFIMMVINTILKYIEDYNEKRSYNYENDYEYDNEFILL